MKTYTIKNNFLELTVLDYGATIVSLKYKGKETIKGYSNLQQYVGDSQYTGKCVGRYANRIGGASFELNGIKYELSANEGKNQLHGGTKSYSERLWTVDADENKIKMTIFSPDGDNGFPGNLIMTVIYTLKNYSLHVDFLGETDADTHFAPTIHPYFLSRGGMLQINADYKVEVNSELIPTGNIVRCKDKYDYSSMKLVDNILDDAFVLNNDYALTFENENLTMELWTDFPAVQIYSGREGSVAIEPEFYPDAPNNKNFPNTVLHPGEKFNKYCEFKFFI